MERTFGAALTLHSGNGGILFQRDLPGGRIAPQEILLLRHFPSRFPIFAASVVMSLSLCPLRGALVAQAQDAPTPDVAPTAVILALRGDRATLSIGATRGARVGAVYGVLRDGQVRVSLRILEVQADRSIAQITGNDVAARFAVGDAVQFIANSQSGPEPEPLPAPNPATPTAPVSNPETPQIQTPSSGANGSSPVNAAPFPVSAAPVASALITAVEGETVTLDSGELQGLRAGRNLPLLRGGEAIGMVRVQSVAPNFSQARVIWKDENIAGIVPGDSVQIPPGALQAGGNPLIVAQNDANTNANRASNPGAVRADDAAQNAGFRPVAGTRSGETAIPTVALRYENGASTIGVPRADRVYELLAALAASGVIKRYPASVFADEGVRFHRTAEDLTFSRAQIADLVREALENRPQTEVSSRDRAILSELSLQFAPELRQLGVATPVLAAYAPRKGFQIGVSGQQRFSFVGGDKNNFLVPFSERQGGSRTRSGFDLRLNLFGRAGSRATFFATIDAGSKPGDRRNGLGNSDSDKFRVRRALVDYDAGNLLRGLTFEVGRNEFWLGPGHFGTLLLGDTAGPLNQIGYNFKRGALSVRGLYAPLDNGPGGTGVRSLYVRDTRFQIGPQASIGFSESVFTPRNRFDAALFATVFSPVPLFITERRGKNPSSEKSNLLQSFYAEAGIARGLRTYGELLIDDIGVNNENLALNRIGTLLGVHIFTPRDPAKLGLYGEFARLQGRTYLRFGNFDPDYDYYYRSRPLGYPVAPTPIPGLFNAPGLGGAESLRLEAYYQPLPKLRLTGGFEFADLNSERQDLSRQQTLRFSAAYSFSQALALSVRGQQVQTSQPNFIPGEARLKQRLFQLELSQAF